MIDDLEASLAADAPSAQALRGPRRSLPARERPVDSATLWTRYFVVLIFVLLAAHGLANFGAGTQGWLALLFLAIVGMRVASRQKKIERMRRRRGAAAVYLQAGDLQRARRQLDLAISDAATFPMLHTSLLADRGVIDLRAGRFTSARARMWAALESDWLPDDGPDMELEGLTVSRYALCEALDGELGSARAWYASAKAHLPGAAPGPLLMAAFVIEAREGTVAAALKDAELAWSRAQTDLTRDELRLLGILIAFARDDAGGEPKDAPEDARAWFDLLAPGEADFLGRNWPAMRAFLRRHSAICPTRP